MRGIRCPRTGRLVDAFKITPDEARLVRKLCADADNADKLKQNIDTQCSATESYVRSMYSDPYDSPMWRRTLVFHAINHIVGGHSVEGLGEGDHWDGYAPPYEYINMGDPYVLTLIFKRATDNLYIGSCGPIVERHPNW